MKKKKNIFPWNDNPELKKTDGGGHTYTKDKKMEH